MIADLFDAFAVGAHCSAISLLQYKQSLDRDTHWERQSHTVSVSIATSDRMCIDFMFYLSPNGEFILINCK